MIRAFYTASSGLVAQSAKQDIIANNIANSNTPGFKRVRPIASSFAQTLEGSLANVKNGLRPAYPESQARSQIAGIQSGIDPTEGTLRNTGNALDFAIGGPGEFEINTPNGIKTTRNGSFQINSKNELCTSEGDLVQGQSGTITIPTDKWMLKPDGSIISNGNLIDKIKIIGGNPEKTMLQQGFVEGSNVNIVSEMVGMITNMRGFEANQKVITSVDQTLEKLINEVGKV